jgi:redox-sensing transcriptional repressor
LGKAVVSCTHIANELKLDPVQVRKDLQYTGIVGSPRIGYPIPALIEAIENSLGWGNLREAFLVGAGSLGTALLGYEGFKECNLNIVAAFDLDASKVGKTVHGRLVLPIEKLADLARRMHIHIGILAVPAEAAQQVADTMLAGDIRAIWNFAPVVLQVPPGTIVENTQLYTSLAVLTARLTEAVIKEREEEFRASNHEQVGDHGPQVREGLRDPGRPPEGLDQADSDPAGCTGGVSIPT